MRGQALRLDRWLLLAGCALAMAIVPGAVRLATVPVPMAERAPIGTERVEPVTVGEVPITPPEEFEGPVAQPTAPPPTFAAAAAPADGEVFALLVGIDDYPGRRADLRSAVADVDTIDAALAGFGVPPGNRMVLRDGQATQDQVRAAISSLVAQGGPSATYVFAYAGHVRKLDADTEALALADGGLLPDIELAELVAPAVTQRMWFLLASCYSGGFTEVLAPGRVLTAAAGARELAWEDPRLNASYLVHYLVREGWLEGKAGDSVQDAFAYADQALAREHPNRRPVEIDALGVPMVLGLGSPASAIGQAPPVPDEPSSPPSSPSSPPPTSPPPTSPPEDEDPPCLLGVLVC